MFVEIIPAAYAQAEGVVQQEGLVSMVTGSGLVVQLVLYLLILFSVFSWGIIFYKLRQVQVARRQSARFLELFWDTKNLTTIHTTSQELKQSPVAQVFRAGYQELVRLTRTKRQSPGAEGGLDTTELVGVANVERAMKRAANQEITRLERALTERQESEKAGIASSSIRPPIAFRSGQRGCTACRSRNGISPPPPTARSGALLR